MLWFIPKDTFKPIQCDTTFCTDEASVVVDGHFHCLIHGTVALLTGAHTPALTV